MFKDLLVYLDGWPRCQVTMRVATLVAKCFNARLTGLHVTGLVIPSQIGINLTETTDALTRGPSLSRLHDAELAAARHAEEIFREQLDRCGLRGSWLVAEGMVAYTAGTRARQFDMTIVGQVDPQHPPLGTRKLVPEALFLESGRPVLVIPCVGEFDSVGARVLVAWDGSREAARAVNDAMPFLEGAAKVSVVTFERSTPAADDMVADPITVVSHLAEHGVQSRGIIRRLGDATVAQALLACSAREQCDLLVMGGYGHSRLHEIVTGGTTRTILRQMNVPVLLSH